MDDVQAVFDDWAETGRGDTMAQGHDFAARVALKRLKISANQRFLDIGCGIGYSALGICHRCISPSLWS